MSGTMILQLIVFQQPKRHSFVSVMSFPILISRSLTGDIQYGWWAVRSLSRIRPVFDSTVSGQGYIRKLSQECSLCSKKLIHHKADWASTSSLLVHFYCCQERSNPGLFYLISKSNYWFYLVSSFQLHYESPFCDRHAKKEIIYKRHSIYRGSRSTRTLVLFVGPVRFSTRGARERGGCADSTSLPTT